RGRKEHARSRLRDGEHERQARDRMSGTDAGLLIYSQDGFGLGHLRRNLNVAYRVWRSRPEVSVLVVADSPAAPFFVLPPRCDFVKIPTLVKVDSGVWRSDRLSLGHKEILSVRTRLLEGLVDSFRPDLMLVDHMPHGIFGELTSPLRILRRRRRRRMRSGDVSSPKIPCGMWSTSMRSGRKLSTRPSRSRVRTERISLWPSERRSERQTPESTFTNVGILTKSQRGGSTKNGAAGESATTSTETSGRDLHTR